MSKIFLGINLNTFFNRYTEPKEWTRIVAKELGLQHVVFSADLLEPYLPFKIQERIAKETLKYCTQYGIKIYGNFGGHTNHQHYFGHPDREIRKEAEKWFIRLIRQTALLKGKGVGTCFAIMSVSDNKNPERRKLIMKEAISSYQRLAKIAKEERLEYLMFEPTSVPRESVATISECHEVLDACKDFAVPMKLCLDVGHRNISSDNPKDGDHLAWIKEFGRVSPIIHIHQTDREGSKHLPFTKKNSKKGIIKPREIIDALKVSGVDETLLAFEITFPAFYPTEKEVIPQLRESVKFWRSYVKE